jgi:hypothetical protein
MLYGDTARKGDNNREREREDSIQFFFDRLLLHLLLLVVVFFSPKTGGTVFLLLAYKNAVCFSTLGRTGRLVDTEQGRERRLFVPLHFFLLVLI